jgi:hypothetical protein
MFEPSVADGRSDFDFYIGNWTVHNRRLKERLAGCTDWDEFPARAIVRPVLGGLGNIDWFAFEGPWAGHEGMTLRLFNPHSGEWSLHWADNGTGGLLAPLFGSFRNGIGTFHAQEMFESRHIFSRYIWTDLSDNHCHWEQAFSADGGATWETNWTMAFTRVVPADPF